MVSIAGSASLLVLFSGDIGCRATTKERIKDAPRDVVTERRGNPTRERRRPSAEEAPHPNPAFPAVGRTEADFWINLGRLHLREGYPERAVDDFSQAVRINPNTVAYNYLGIACRDIGEYRDAERAFQGAVRMDPRDAEAHANLALVYGHMGRHTAALEALGEATRLDPRFADTYTSLAVLYIEQGLYAEAEQVSSEARNANPDDARAYKTLAAAYGRMGQHLEAAGACEQAIWIDPSDRELYKNLGTASLIFHALN